MNTPFAVFRAPDFDAHEEIVFVHDARAGLHAIVAIHSTQRGPALGGCRMFPYATESDAIRDVLRLSRGMSYKAAAAGIQLGGGKSVIIGDPRREKTQALLTAMGRAIERFGGRYITGEDIGTNPDDMRVIRQQTSAVSCLTEADGGYGDPAPLTALGVLQAIKAGLIFARGSDHLKGVVVAVQGVGNVGLNLCKQLVAQGANLLVCDTFAANAAQAEALGARVVPADAIYATDADVFAPCAVGATLNDATIAQLKVQVVAGAANNQLAEARHAESLGARGIVYLPDYVANAGGLISCAAEWYRTPRSDIRPAVLKIGATCRAIIQRSKERNETTLAAADEIARMQLAAQGVATLDPVAT